MSERYDNGGRWESRETEAVYLGSRLGKGGKKERRSAREGRKT